MNDDLKLKTITTLDDLLRAKDKPCVVDDTKPCDQESGANDTSDQDTSETETPHLSVEDMLSEITFQDLVNYVDTSVRLKNSILADADNERFPFMNLADYYYADQDHKDRINRIPGFGKRSRINLDASIETLVGDEDRLRLIYAHTQGASNIASTDRVLATTESEPVDAILQSFFQISLKDFVEIADVMPRTRNSILRSSEIIHELFPTIGDYISSTDSNQLRLLEIPDFGKTSKSNLDNVIRCLTSNRGKLAFLMKKSGFYIDSDGLQQLTNQLNIHASQNPLAEIKESIVKILKKRSLEVLELRLEQKKTLEEVGTIYSLTRERIRQIELQGIEKTRNSFLLEISYFRSRLISILDEYNGAVDYRTVLDGWPEVDSLSFKILLSAVNSEDVPVFKLAKGIICRKEYHEGSDWIYSQIDKVFLTGDFPVNISSIEIRIPDIPRILIKRRLQSRYDAVIHDDVVTRVRLTTGQQARFALRSLGKPSHHSEVYNKMRDLFDTQVKPHAVEGDLGRSSDILIVDRGTYALYETFWLSDDDIQQIREESYRHLREHGDYIRANQLMSEVFTEGQFTGGKLNPYIILGVLQDDDQNFKTKPGLVIGLSDFGDTFQISDLIRDIVREHGPIHIEDVRKLLPDTRRVNNETISTCLLTDDALVRQKSGTYDTAERVLGSIDELDMLLGEIRFQLLQHELTLMQVFEMLVKDKYSKLTEYGLNYLLKRYFQLNKNTSHFCIK